MSRAILVLSFACVGVVCTLVSFTPAFWRKREGVKLATWGFVFAIVGLLLALFT